jgi:molybdate transport system substrate-binding protein
MKKKFTVLISIMIMPLLVMISIPAKAAEVRLSAAASMADSLKEIVASFGKERPGTVIRTNFGASGTLAKQIVSGAPVDLFISADPKRVDVLIKEGKVAAPTVRTLAFNTLVLVGPEKIAISSLADLTQLERIAIGSPKSVPAGMQSRLCRRWEYMPHCGQATSW